MARRSNTTSILIFWLFCNHISTAFVLPPCRRAASHQTRSLTTTSGTARISLCAEDMKQSSSSAASRHQRRNGWRRRLWFPKKKPNTRSIPRLFPRALAAISLMFSVLVSFRRHAWAAASAAASTTSKTTLPPVVGVAELGMAAALVYYTGVMTLQIQGSYLRPLALSLVKACGRCAAQLYLAGGLLLTPLFAATNPLIVAGWLGFTAWLAAKEASSRVEFTYPKLYKHMFLALTSSLSLVVTVTLGLGILEPKPWFSPRSWIPICGMLLGNSVTATALAAGTLTRQLATSQSQLEWQLARGATWREALAGVLQSTYTSALTPTMNSLAVTGVVFIPGMMTGQLLAGQSPMQAAAYQVLIYFLIASTVCASVQTLTQLTVRTLMDPQSERLRMSDSTGQPLLQPTIPHASNIFSWSTVKDQWRHLRKLWRVQRLRMVRKRQQRQQTQQQTQRRTASHGLLVVSGDDDDPVATRARRESSSSTPFFATVEDDAARIEREMGLGMLDGVPIGGAPQAASVTVTGSEMFADNSAYFSIGDNTVRRGTRPPASVRYRGRQPTEHMATEDAASTENYSVILKADKMKVDRTTLSLSLDICSGDIIGIQGPSGIGKSQLLRTLAGLESLDRSTVSFYGRPASAMAMSDWRQKIALVPQERPSLEGTPREFFERALSFQSQRPQPSSKEQQDGSQPPRPSKGFLDLTTLIGRWGLPIHVLDQSWSTLSGGEAQRVSLAIAIALKPSVLLLDESTSALDEDTTLTVENSLKALEIPIVMVSHDKEQIRRFCNQVIDLVPAGPFMR